MRSLKILAISIASLLANGVANSNAAEITCPADVYSSGYERYLAEMREKYGFVVEPQVYGSVGEIDRLSSKFSHLQVPQDKGIVFVFTDFDLRKLDVATCENCSPSAYQGLLAQCSAKLGARCIDFAVVTGATAQCMLIPKPEI